MNDNSDKNKNLLKTVIDIVLGLAIFFGSFFILSAVMGNMNSDANALIAAIIVTAIIAMAGVKLSKKGYKAAGGMAITAAVLIAIGLVIFGSCALTFRIG